MQLPLYNQKAENIGKVDLPDSVFGLAMNADLLYQVTTSQLSNRRQVVAHAKGRGEVRGGGKKPWKQKGTGRARHGSIRSPIWKGGGVTHGPTKEANFKKKINRKMAQKALAVVLSGKVRDKELLVVDQIGFDNWKTKEMAIVIKSLTGVFTGGKTFLLVAPNGQFKDLKRVSANIPNVDVAEVRNLNALDAMSKKNLIFLKSAIDNMAPKAK